MWRDKGCIPLNSPLIEQVSRASAAGQRVTAAGDSGNLGVW
jgi:hypothetical protein